MAGVDFTNQTDFQGWLVPSQINVLRNSSYSAWQVPTYPMKLTSDRRGKKAVPNNNVYRPSSESNVENRRKL